MTMPNEKGFYILNERVILYSTVLMKTVVSLFTKLNLENKIVKLHISTIKNYFH